VAAIYRRAALHDETQRAGQPTLAVGFADLTGFTELSQGWSPQELTKVIVSFEQRAFDLIAERGGRVIKTIGDEIMFIFDTAAGAVDLALQLCVVEKDDVPPLRVGVALGPVLIRQGDCYGPTVNLASRITGVARSGEVVVDETAGHALAGDPRFNLTRLGNVALKGLGTVRLSQVHRAR
jgi:adenylate cyclase